MMLNAEAKVNIGLANQTRNSPHRWNADIFVSLRVDADFIVIYERGASTR
jgi:hypothetical protein